MSAAGYLPPDAPTNNDYLRRIAEGIYLMSAYGVIPDATSRVSTIGDTNLVVAPIVEVVGIPDHVADVTQHAEYGITEPGWYAFARILARAGTAVTATTTVTGAAGHIAIVGEDHIDLAIRFEVAAQSVPVTIAWDDYQETIVFRATDLAVRNLDYRTTFYVYDLAEFATWEYALTTDTAFADGKTYYTLVDDEYVPLALGDELLVGDPVPADSYYTHTKLTLEGMVRNVTYKLDTIIDCPVEVVLPDVPDDGYGAWYEMQLHHGASYSMTLTVPEGVKAATDTTPSQTAGINILDLHYANVDGIKVWRLVNTHSTYPYATGAGHLSMEFASPPDKVEYAVGEALDLTGLRVISHRSDGSTANVTSQCTFSPANGATLKATDTTLTATLALAVGSLTATTPLTVT